MLEKIKILDHKILLWIHKNLSNSILDVFMPFITNEDNWIIPITVLVIVLCIFAEKKGKIAIIILLITLGLTDSICAQFIKPFIERIRPSHLDLEGLNLLVKKGGKWSMPSNHAANMFAFATTLSFFYKRYKTFLFILASLIAFSRVYVGVHFPGDIFFGALIGYIISWSLLTTWNNIKIRELIKGNSWVWYETPNLKFKKLVR